MKTDNISPRSPSSPLYEIGQLAHSRTLLVLWLLTVGSVFLPYDGLFHDAVLYAAQALNKFDRHLSEDVFFKFGSQDSFTTYSWIGGVILGLLGVDLGCWVLYAVSKVVFVLGLVELSKRFVTHRGWLSLCCLVVCICPLPYGGLQVFAVNEPFLTPRLIVNGLCLLALAIGHERKRLSVVLLAIALSLHPLQSAPAIGAFVLIQLSSRLGQRRAVLVYLAAFAGFALTLTSERLGFLLYGEMDPLWRSLVAARSEFLYPSYWELSDWIRLATAMILVVLHAVLRRGAGRSISLSILLVSIGGMFFALAGERAPFALFVQVQPYRALWLLQAWSVIALCDLFSSSWDQASNAGRNMFVLALLIIISALCLDVEGTAVAPALLSGMGIYYTAVFIAWRIRRRKPASSLIVLSVMATLLLRFGANAIWFLNSPPEVPKFMSSFSVVSWLLGTSSTIGTLGWAFVGSILVVRLFRTTFAVSTVLSALFFVSSVFSFWLTLPGVVWGDSECEAESERDRVFVERFFRANQLKKGSVYWPGEPAAAWTRLGLPNYFTTMNQAGNIFYRDTAIEGLVRARKVRRYEIEEIARCAISLEKLPFYSKLFAYCDASDKPTLVDLSRVCRQQDVRFAVVRQIFPEIAAATNGSVAIYYCERVSKFCENSPTVCGDQSKDLLTGIRVPLCQGHNGVIQ